MQTRAFSLLLSSDKVLLTCGVVMVRCKLASITKALKLSILGNQFQQSFPCGQVLSSRILYYIHLLPQQIALLVLRMVYHNHSSFCLNFPPDKTFHLILSPVSAWLGLVWSVGSGQTNSNNYHHFYR